MTKQALKDSELYIGDNGRCFCGTHAGCSAKYTGRDISGQKVMRVTQADAIQSHMTLRCESRGCTVARG